jgi:hypothetical protein
LPWNNEFVEYPTAGQAWIACEVSLPEWGQQQESTKGLSQVLSESPSL